MRPLGNDTITILKPDITTDSRDNAEIIDFSSPTEITVTKCAVEPFMLAEKLQEEETRERDFARSTLRVWMPITEDTLAIQPRDRIRHDGIEYEVFGHIGVWKDSRGVAQHIAFVIQLRTG